MKQGCPFYVSFIQFGDTTVLYRCNGISSIHTCPKDLLTWDWYPRYQNQNTNVRGTAVILMQNGIQAASVLNQQYGMEIQAKDIYRIMQITHERS